MTSGDRVILVIYAVGAFLVLVAVAARLAGYWWTWGVLKAKAYWEKKRSDEREGHTP